MMTHAAGTQNNEYSRVFIGSSSENGLVFARHLQAELDPLPSCEATLWNRIFEVSGYALDSLCQAASEVDFAVLIATPDDITVSRGVESVSARDNVMLEFGLFVGALGRERTYMLATDPAVKIPSDVLGLTRLPYQPRQDGDVGAALNRAVLEIERQVARLGCRRAVSNRSSSRNVDAAALLERELTRLCNNAIAQGWKIKKNDDTTLRLRTPRGRIHTLVKEGKPELTRIALRHFANELRSAGLRVNSSVRRPVSS